MTAPALTLPPLSSDFTASRTAARLIAIHILARARHGVTKRIDLAPSPGGFGTPAFGPDHRVLRVSGDLLIDESTGDGPRTRIVSWPGQTLAGLATFVGVELNADFSAGHDTPELTDELVNETLHGAAVAIHQLGGWYAVGRLATDGLLGELRDAPLSTRARIWPEHFDLGIDLAGANGQRVNFGASPGDEFHDEPYLYVSPWEADRPGDPEFWNAPFGAMLGYDELRTAAKPSATGVAFFRRGLHQFG